MITVTLQQIKDAEPCASGWAKVLKANGGTDADMEKPFPLASILDSNDLDDTLWVISNVPELSEHDEIWRKFACWCAMQNIEKIAKHCSQDDYNLIIQWLETNDPDLRESAEYVARSARSAAESARSAARSARSAAESARSAAWSALSAAESARSAAWSALSAAESAWSAWSAWSARSAWSAWSARSAQEQKLRELLSNNQSSGRIYEKSRLK